MKTKLSLIISLLVFSTACASHQVSSEPTYNEKELKAQLLNSSAMTNQDKLDAVADPMQASLWAKSAGSPYLIRNQKAQKVGDLLTIMVDESATAETSAGTQAKRDGKLDVSATAKLGQGTATQIGEMGLSGSNKNEFKGEGKTDRAGKLQTTVQAVVENVISNGTLFVRGRKTITINNEDQEVEVTGFVRPDDIRINNTVASGMMADAKIRYVGEGVISDKQRVGWGVRLMDAIWPF